jgi:hypothetical protein
MDREQIWQWVQDEADAHHGGDWLAAAVAILGAARERELNPGALWAELETRMRYRPDSARFSGGSSAT